MMKRSKNVGRAFRHFLGADHGIEANGKMQYRRFMPLFSQSEILQVSESSFDLFPSVSVFQPFLRTKSLQLSCESGSISLSERKTIDFNIISKRSYGKSTEWIEDSDFPGRIPSDSSKEPPEESDADSAKTSDKAPEKHEPASERGKKSWFESKPKTTGDSRIDPLEPSKRELLQIAEHPVIDDALHIPEVWGRVHSFESFSAVDGPGVRSVVFMQGCLRRCLFCANPDTWSPLENCLRLSSKNIAAKLRKNLPYYEGGGGVTMSGGEPMMQPHFCAAVFKEAHALGITTCIDTAGHGKAHDFAAVLPHTDRVLFCAKAMDPSLYQELVGIPQRSMLMFAKAINDYNVPLIIRWVLLADMTDTIEEITALIEFAKNQRSLVGIEVLPYHTLGKNKWAALNMKYPLEGMSTPKKQSVERTRKMLTDAGIKVMI